MGRLLLAYLGDLHHLVQLVHVAGDEIQER